MHNFKKIALCLPFFALLAGCASTQQESQTPTPVARSITLKGSPSAENPNPANIEKNLFNVRVTANKLYLNDTIIKDTQKLETYLRSSNKPVVTIVVHRCVDSSLAKSILSMVQDYTDTPIPYTSYGKLTDSSCQIE